MHGFGARILHALPLDGPGATARHVREIIEEQGHRAPSLGTIRKHLNELVELHVVQVGEQAAPRRYFRVVEPVLGEPLAVEA